MMPAFRDWPTEAGIIARLLSGYGELEFMLGLCLGHALGDRRKAMRVLFRTRGETPRINLADAFTADAAAADGLQAEYADCLGGIRACLSIRNRFSHCHWATLPQGLFFVSLGEAAQAGDKFEFKWKSASLPILTGIEAYFIYVHECFLHVDYQMNAKRGGPENLYTPMPKKRQPPLEPDPLAPDILASLPKGL